MLAPLHAFITGKMDKLPELPAHPLAHPLHRSGFFPNLNESERRKVIALSGKYLLKMQAKREVTLRRLAKAFPKWFKWAPELSKDVSNKLFNL